MTDSALLQLPQAQRERLFFIDFRLYFLATLNRNDLVSRFGIKEAAATRDITAYRAFRPDNAVYDTNAKAYLKGKQFKPLFSYSAKQALRALSEGIGDDFVGTHTPLLRCETPTELNHPDVSVLAVLCNAIAQSKALQMEYHSLSSGTSTRELAPFALVDNGLRWHVRGYDRRRERFGDFVLTRITSVRVLDGPLAEREFRDADIQWNRIVEMELVPHPKLEHTKPVELDYGMTEGVLRQNVRAAVAGYVLRRWNVDCTEDHSLEGMEFHLWLRNTPALYGVANLEIAPGYQKD